MVACPYCGEIQKQPPLRKKKCPSCKNFIYPRIMLSNGEKVYTTEDKVKEIDLINKWIKNFGLTTRAFQNRKKKLSDKFGQLANDRDIIWERFNEAIAKTKDFHSLKMIYYNMALFLNEEGKDCFEYLQLATKMDLLYYKQSGVVKKVKIHTCGSASCEECRKLSNGIFEIEEALEQMPIPSRYCTNKLYNEKYGFCRCIYLPIIN